ncbi:MULTISPECIES: YiiX/YebB-like N1pC/P60 family cysteine hydrolase [unclassified Carboxylicivirga]|uniref:YiiX/YebB-like N1pC/P60 family cysteine hydrolase n=1 Tax=Carboxylicivirga TaxID=1628153 RepID=UPI003D347118
MQKMEIYRAFGKSGVEGFINYHLTPHRDNSVSKPYGRLVYALFVMILMLSALACSTTNEQLAFKDGDILFRGQLDGSLSQAIDAVTQTDSSHHYTHVGVVEVEQDTVWVLHAAPGKGVCKELLADFCRFGQDAVVVGHYRIRGIDSKAVDRALGLANSLLGQPYNYSYLMEDEGYYCSEFVYEVFSGDSIFQLAPMTFIDPSSDSFHDGWVQHYADLGIPVPEGKPGCNPNGMAANESLVFLRYLE